MTTKNEEETSRFETGGESGGQTSPTSVETCSHRNCIGPLGCVLTGSTVGIWRWIVCLNCGAYKLWRDDEQHHEHCKSAEVIPWQTPALLATVEAQAAEHFMTDLEQQVASDVGVSLTENGEVYVVPEIIAHRTTQNIWKALLRYAKRNQELEQALREISETWEQERGCIWAEAANVGDAIIRARPLLHSSAEIAPKTSPTSEEG